ncbi:MAG: response regulator, partial [Kofleriaceae bacterium]
VDDQPDVVELLCVLLTRSGHECMTAGSGIEAIELAASFAPEVVLLDIGLPDMTGYAVARALRATSGGTALYIAAVTGYGTEEDRKLSREAGFDRHLLKPVKGAAIAELLTEAATRRSGHRA